MKIFAINIFNHLNAQKTAAFTGKNRDTKKVIYQDGDRVIKSVVYPRKKGDKSYTMFMTPGELMQFKDRITGVAIYNELLCDEYKQYCDDEDDYFEYLREHDDD